MTLEEAFAKYDDATELRRVGYTTEYSIEWLKALKAWSNEESRGLEKVLKAWSNQESRGLAFVIPQFFMDDVNADDWELVSEDTL